MHLQRHDRPDGQRMGEGEARGGALEAHGGACRRAYYRVEGRLPLRVSRLAPDEIDQAIFELGTPPALMAPLSDAVEDSPLHDRLRRVEEKLDLLLGHAGIDVPRPLGARDRRAVVFSGSGLATDVNWSFRRAEAFRVEILLPAPERRLLRAVAHAVEDSPRLLEAGASCRLALALSHMADEERDALVAYSYELQRVALRAARGARRGQV